MKEINQVITQLIFVRWLTKVLQKVGQYSLGVTACLHVYKTHDFVKIMGLLFMYFLVIFHKNVFCRSPNLLWTVYQPATPHSFLLAHKISTVPVYFGNHRDDIEKQGKVSFHRHTALCQETCHLILDRWFHTWHRLVVP